MDGGSVTIVGYCVAPFSKILVLDTIIFTMTGNVDTVLSVGGLVPNTLVAVIAITYVVFGVNDFSV